MDMKMEVLEDLVRKDGYENGNIGIEKSNREEQQLNPKF